MMTTGNSLRNAVLFLIANLECQGIQFNDSADLLCDAPTCHKPYGLLATMTLPKPGYS